MSGATLTRIGLVMVAIAAHSMVARFAMALASPACHLDAQRIESGQRVCFYDCAGRPYVVRIALAKECAATLDR